MKNLLKKASMPIIVFGLAVGGVFATNVVKNAELQDDEMIGHLRVNNDPTDCDPKKLCTTIAINEVCTWTSKDEVLFGIDQNIGSSTYLQCVVPLYEINAK